LPETRIFSLAALSLGVPLAETLVWRTRRVEPSGFFYLGARYYDGTSGRFLSPDPLGHAASMDLYSFADGDPLNNFDADGSFVSGGLNGGGQWKSQMHASMGNGLDAMLKPLALMGARLGIGNQFSAEVNYNGGYEADFQYQRNFDQGSDAFQLGHQVGYTAAEIGFQVGLIAATEGFGTIAHGAALRSAGGIGVQNVTARYVASAQGLASRAAAARAPVVSLQGPTMTGSTGAGQSVTMTIDASKSVVAAPQPTLAYRAGVNYNFETFNQSLGAYVKPNSAVKSGVQENRLAGLAGEDFLKRTYGGGKISLNTSGGWRHIDNFVDGIAMESKVGRTSLSKRIQRQINKDVELMNTPGSGVNAVEWHFSPGKTGVGPSAPLRDALTKAGIKIVIKK
jgi:RHS repeat-associated protein